MKHKRGGRGSKLPIPETFTVSLWDSLEAVTAFAGEDVERAVFYPEDERFLVGREWTAAHYEWLTGRDPAPEA